jgi:hypothetical protein
MVGGSVVAEQMAVAVRPALWPPWAVVIIATGDATWRIATLKSSAEMALTWLGRDFGALAILKLSIRRICLVYCLPDPKDR